MPPLATVTDEDHIKSQKGFYILGKDIREIPCFRSSLLLGITSGTFVGLVTFMFTSKAALSSHVGFGSLWLAVLAYWIPCRYKLEVEKTKLRYNSAGILYERAALQRDSLLPKTEVEKNEQTKE